MSIGERIVGMIFVLFIVASFLFILCDTIGLSVFIPVMLLLLSGACTALLGLAVLIDTFIFGGTLF